MTDNPLTPLTKGPVPAGMAGGPGERIRRLERRRRLLREELLAVLVLLLFLAVTVAVLATQWLSSGPAAGSLGPPPTASNLVPTGGTT